MNAARLRCATALKVTGGRRGYQNFVTSDVLKGLEKYCERVCPVPRVPPQKVTVIGAGTSVGRIVCLLLKQQPLVKVLSMYDLYPCNNVLGVAQDIAHIDTSTEVEAYQGRSCLKYAVEARRLSAPPSAPTDGGTMLRVRLFIGASHTAHIYIKNADVVVVCGGPAVLPCCCCEKELFLHNMSQVHMATRAVALFAPDAVLAIQTPPVDCNFSLAITTLKLIKKYNKRRVLGVNSLSAMRANQLLAMVMGAEAADGGVAVVGGCGRCTRVPVFKSKAGNIPDSQLDHLTYLVREADDIIANVKCCTEEAHLSSGMATARCVINIMKGIFEKETILDSALVEQDSPKDCYGMEICATPVKISRRGISSYLVPQLAPSEQKLLDAAKCDLEDLLTLGRCFAAGEEYRIPYCKLCPAPNT